MKRLTVNVKNYRCLANISVEMRDLTVLLGPNGAGKSSFLHALAFFFENTALDTTDAFRGDGRTVPVQCIFGALTDGDPAALGPYALGDQVVLRRSWTPGTDPGAHRSRTPLPPLQEGPIEERTRIHSGVHGPARRQLATIGRHG
jgi:energy-coupling factor transporter ATP-binding protein EcfA2